MNKFFLEKTEFTPEIDFDIHTRKFTFRGVSRPEDVFKFYEPAINWLNEFDREIQSHTYEKYNIPSINVDFYLTYFNSASSKVLMQILEIFKKIQNKGIEININWYYDKTDEQMYDDITDLAEFAEMKFNFYKL